MPYREIPPMSPYKSIQRTLLVALLILSGYPVLALSADDIATKIIGTWKGPCFDMGKTTPAGRYIRSTAIYGSGGSYEDKTIFYKDSACRIPGGGVKRSKGTYRLGRRITTPGGKTAYYIDLHYISNFYNNMRMPSVRIKNIIRVNGNTMTMGQLTPRTLRTRPSELDPSVPAIRQ